VADELGRQPKTLNRLEGHGGTAEGRLTQIRELVDQQDLLAGPGELGGQITTSWPSAHHQHIPQLLGQLWVGYREPQGGIRGY
jgi:hypothetical protein